MNIQDKFRGTGAALITPFSANGSVDFKSLKKLVDHVIDGGVEFLVVFGTTGEPITISESEKKDIIDFICECNTKKIPMILGCGGNNTNEIADKASKVDTRFDAILSVVPYYNKPNQRGMFQHYKTVSEASALPVIAYNVPGRTGCNLAAETTIKIANELPNVIGLKEASPSVEQFTYIKKDVPESFMVFSGDDSIVVPHMSLGAWGAISVTANVMPKMYSDMIRLCIANKYDEALKLHLKLIEFTDSLFTEGSPAGAKAALSQMGIVENYLRLPLVPVTDKHFEYMKGLIAKLK